MARARRVPIRLLAAGLLALLPGLVPLGLTSAASATPAGSAVSAGTAASATTSGPPEIVPAVDAGPPGLTVGVSGSGYQSGTTYGLCLLPPAKVQCGYAGSDLGSFTADASGAVPAGTQVEVPGVLADSYHLVATAPGSASIVATALFQVTAPTLSLDQQAGPGGLVVSVSGSGYAPSVAYGLCIVPSGTPECGGVGVSLGDVTADGSGSLPAGTTVTIPGQLPATYDLGVLLKGGSVPNLLVTEPFVEVAPTLALNPSAGPGGTAAAVTGAGLAPGGKYTVCIVPPATTQCGGSGTDLLSFVADAGGAVPDGTTVTVPAGPAGDYAVGIVLQGSTPFLLGSVTFSRTAGSPPPAGPPGQPEATPAASDGGAGRPSNRSPSAAPAASDQGPGGTIVWVIVALAIVAAIVVGLVLSRRRQTNRRR